jgi:serine/threonine-protein kinase
MSDSGRQRSPVAPGAIVAGKYRVERVLGAGGMGVVVAARHKDLGHLVAIKLLLGQHADRADVVERFLREARAAVQLKSEHAVRVSDVGVHQPRASAGFAPRAVPYMVMEYLDGTSLWGVLNRGPIPPADAAEYIAQACEALEEAHRIGIVHRDLKPDNLFVVGPPGGAPRG